jgi:glycine/D-amino acid oxidase-like deaminating enzyme/nitrite reductase/ring-hydroxylating ferredoxin subunit
MAHDRVNPEPQPPKVQSTDPVWREGVEPLAYEPLARSTTADVCVIGSGIAGLTTAWRLSREGRQVVVLDAGEVGNGETGRTTAHLSWAIDDRYRHLIGWRGAAIARIAADSHAAAIDTIESIVSDEAIRCEFRRVPGYLVLPEGGERDALEKELDAVRELGIHSVEWVESLALHGHDFGPALRWPGQGQIHALRYLHGIAESLWARGVQIHGHTRVRDVREGTPIQVVTEEGRVVRAPHVVIATNAPLDSPVEIYFKEFAQRTYAISLALPDGVPELALLWDDDDPYHYVRVVERPDGEGPLLIVGGEDHPTGATEEGGPRWDRLESWARARFPRAGVRRHQWSGQVFETIDGLGLIGRAPGMPDGTFIITGDSGMGMTHGTLGALLVSDLVLGRASPWAEAYDPLRTPVRAAAEFVRGLSPHAAAMVSKPIEAALAGDEIPPGTGKVITVDREPIAVYRDADGHVTRLSARCTHRGCVVSWNPAEHTWDCACHGSRFDGQGRVLNAPAVEPLAAADSEAQRRAG